MNFAALSFWTALLIGVSLIALVRWLILRNGIPAKSFDKISLLFLNLTLLFLESWLTLTIFSAVLIITYLTLIWLRNGTLAGTRKHILLGVLIFIQFTPLIYYKYGYFILHDIFHASDQSGFLKGILIPTGLSFYTFQMVSVVLDYAKDHSRFPKFIDYCNFASFFPQIVAGPIERRDDLLPQMEKFAWRFSWINIWLGFRWVILGLFFKLSLAENIAAFSGWCFHPSDNPYLIWAGSALFGLRIYYDFAGYSLVAFGLGKMLGVRLELNFWSPYTATDIQSFWRRWHRTLSNWFRDYIYFPLGGGRGRFWIGTTLLVFVVSGIWHGAGFNFIAWGAAHGILLIAHRLFKNPIARLPKAVTWFSTMIFVSLTWLLFYQTDWAILCEKLTAIVTVRNYSIPNAYAALRSLGYTDVFGIFCWGSLGVIQIAVEGLSFRRYGNPYQLYRPFWVVLTMVIILIFTAPVVQNAFIYFNF